MRHRIAVAAAVVACAIPAAAQEQQATESARRAAVEIAVQEERAKVGVESRIVRGAPYSAEAVTETVQALADGNRIVRQSVTRIFRDSEGRTRRETVGSDGQVSTVVDQRPGVRVAVDADARAANRASQRRHHRQPWRQLLLRGGPALGQWDCCGDADTGWRCQGRGEGEP